MSKSNCRTLQFLHQMFNVSALLLNDAFLKCVVTEVVGLLFSIVAVKTHHISQGSVTTHLRCGGIFSDSIIANGLLILIVKKFENRSIFDEVKAYKTKCASFFATLYRSCRNRAYRSARFITVDRPTRWRICSVYFAHTHAA